MRPTECPFTLRQLSDALARGKFKITALQLYDKYGLDAPDSALGWIVDDDGQQMTVAIFDAADPHFQVHWMDCNGAGRAWHVGFDGTVQQTIDEEGAWADEVIAPLGTLTELAKKVLGWETLEVRGMDSLDFHDTSVSAVRSLLITVYELGFRDARKQEGE